MAPESDEANKYVAPSLERVKADKQSAAQYTQRKPAKHRDEMRMVAEAFATLPGSARGKVLDAPCGVGRLCVWLAEQGYELTGVDLGEAAVELTRSALAERGLDGRILTQNIMAMDFSDREFEYAICFRLIHHYEQKQLKAQLVDELCRVTNNCVVISYISPVSVTSMRRRLRHRFSGKAIKQYPDSLGDLQELFARNGFKFIYKVKRSALLHSLQLAIFQRES